MKAKLRKQDHVKYCASVWIKYEVDSASLALISSSICVNMFLLCVLVEPY